MSPMKARIAGRALPEHAEEEGREERRIHEGKDELEEIHDVVEVRAQGRRRPC